MTSKGPVGEALDVQRSRPSSVRFVAEKYDVEASADDLDFDKPAGPRHHPKPHIAPQRPNLKPAAVDVDQPPASKTAGKAGAGAGLHDSGVPTPAAMRAKFDEAFPAQVGPTRADFVDPKAKKKRSWVSKIVHKMGDPTGKQKHKNKDAKQNQLKLYRRSNSSRAAEKPVGQPASAQPGSATPAQSREAAAAAACAANAEPAPDQQAQLIPASSNQPEPVSRRQSYTSAASSGNSGTNLMTAEPSCISLTQVASRTPSGQPAPRNPSILGRGTAASPTKAAAPPKVDNWLMQLFVQWQPRQRLLSDDPAAGGKGGKYQEGSYAEWSAKSADLIRAKSKSDSKTCLSPSRLASGLSGLARLGSQQASPDGIRASQDGRAGSDSGSARSSYMLPQMFDSGAKQERTRHGCLGCCAPKTRN
ncbi:hypothetical protein WJX72_003275 [[Myrmecia] bisecta]|uniref:Uncharacterized protein n=1 Tax=[Myrmecia] bisecta TaxID=41462 RepID=A0AAW1Q6V2_9CHLO